MKNPTITILYSICLFTTPIGSGLSAEQIFLADFENDALPPQIKPYHETLWSVEKGILIGKAATPAQQKINKESSSGHFGLNPKMGIMTEFHDAVIRFDFRVDEEGAVVLVINAPGLSHLLNISLGPDEVSVLKKRDKKLRGSENTELGSARIRLETRKWHSAEVGMEGNKVTVALDDMTVLEVADDRFDVKKHKPTFRTAGVETLYLDNIEILAL